MDEYVYADVIVLRTLFFFPPSRFRETALLSALGKHIISTSTHYTSPPPTTLSDGFLPDCGPPPRAAATARSSSSSSSAFCCNSTDIMGRGPARPINFAEDGPRPDPAHRIFNFSRPGPAHHNFKFLGPARPRALQFCARPGPTAHDKPWHFSFFFYFSFVQKISKKHLRGTWYLLPGTRYVFIVSVLTNKTLAENVNDCIQNQTGTEENGNVLY